MSFWKETHIKKSRSKHRCEYCCGVIFPGKSYFRETGVYYGDFNDYCICERCRTALDFFNFDENLDHLASFYDELLNSDILDCLNCGRNSLREYEFTDNATFCNCECDNCGKMYIVDLSKQKFEKLLKGK